MRKIMFLVALTAFVGPPIALAQTASVEAKARDEVARQADSLEGRVVLDSNGDVIGHVERVVAGPDGKPAQILVRPKGVRAGGPRSLSARSVSLTEKGVQIPLTRAEFEAMPAVGPKAQ